MCDLDPDARAVLRERMSRNDIHECPVFKCVKKLRVADVPNARDIDIIAGGFPCQDLSPMGNRAGISGPRSGLIAEVLRLVEESGTTLVFLENVPNLVQKGLASIVRTLNDLGFDVSWCTVSASMMHAPHHRKRLFILAKRRGTTPSITVAKYRPIVQWTKPAEPVRMVPESEVRSNHRTKRCMLLGNAVVPIALRAAFVTMASGFAVAPCDTVNRTEIALNFPKPRNLLSAVTGLNTKPFPSWGFADETGVHIVPVITRIPKPVFDMCLDPSAFQGTRRQEARGERSPTLMEPVSMSYWSTPRSVISAGRILTKRMVRDLPTQVRFERTTPDNLRSGQISANFVEWMMGYPPNWTSMPDDHVTVMPVGYRPNLKKRPEYENCA